MRKRRRIGSRNSWYEGEAEATGGGAEIGDCKEEKGSGGNRNRNRRGAEGEERLGRRLVFPNSTPPFIYIHLPLLFFYFSFLISPN